MEIEGVRERERERGGDGGERARAWQRSPEAFLLHQFSPLHESTIHQQAFKQLVLRAALPCSPDSPKCTNPGTHAASQGSFSLLARNRRQHESPIHHHSSSLPSLPPLSLSLSASLSLSPSASTIRWTPSALEGLNGVLGANLKAFEILH